MKKPAHQWETRLHLAVRASGPVPGFEHDSRAEAFVLDFHDGRRGGATLGLEQQFVDDVGASDPDLAHAVMCWLCARGERRVNLWLRDGERESPLCVRSFRTHELGDVQAKAPSARVISLCPSNAELLHGLACIERVIACEDSSDFPPELAALPRLGPDLAPDLNRVAAFEPELVLSSLSVPGMERNVTGLRARGVSQVVLAPRSLADVLDEISLLGVVLDVEARAAVLRAELEAQRDELLAACPRDPVPVYLEWWPKPMYTPGRTCFSNELIALAGGRNVFGERPGSSVEVDDADLEAAAPEVCFLSWCGVHVDKLDPQNLLRRAGLGTLPAVQNRRVYALDERYSGRPGPRMLEAARIMARAIRPIAEATHRVTGE